MKKLFALLIALMMVLSLAACGGNEETPSGNNENPSSNQQNEQNQQDEQPSNNEDGNEELTELEEAALAFTQFGIDMDDVTVDIEGEVPSYAFLSVKVVDPLSYSALARWQLKLANPITDEQVAAYREQIYNVLKAAADDGEIYYTSNSQAGQTIPLDDYFGSCYYKYKDCKLKVSLRLDDHIGIEINYVEPWE